MGLSLLDELHLKASFPFSPVRTYSILEPEQLLGGKNFANFLFGGIAFGSVVHLYAVCTMWKKEILHLLQHVSLLLTLAGIENFP